MYLSNTIFAIQTTLGVRIIPEYLLSETDRILAVLPEPVELVEDLRGRFPGYSNTQLLQVVVRRLKTVGEFVPGVDQDVIIDQYLRERVGSAGSLCCPAQA